MDAPESPPAGPSAPAAVALYEDSPVFNFIKNLSPIATMKPPDSARNVQLFKASHSEPVPSIFTSPQVNPQKESNLTIRDYYAQLSRGLNPNCQMSQIGTSSCIDLPGSTTTASENCSSNWSLNKVPAHVCPKNVSVFPSKWPLLCSENLGDDKKQETDGKTEHAVDVEQVKLSSTCSDQNGLDLNSSFSGRSVQENVLAKQYNEELAACNLNYLITHCGTGGSVVSKSDLSLETEERPFNWKQRSDDVRSSKSFMPVGQEDLENSGRKLVDGSAGCYIQSAPDDINVYCDRPTVATNYDPKVLPGGSQSQLVSNDYFFDTLKVPSDDALIDNALSQHRCGMHRRTLFDETAGASNMCTHTTSNLHHASTCGENYLKPAGSSACALPGIGLHLNSIPSISKDITPYDNETSGGPSNNMPFAVDRQLQPDQNCPMKSVVSGNELVCFSSEVDCLIQLNQSTQKPMPNVDKSGQGSHKKKSLIQLNQSTQKPMPNVDKSGQGSHKKKKCKFQNGDGNSCRRCSCKKSKCLKLYCACFAAKVYCSEFCSCQGCFNNHTQEETVLCTRKQTESRNPLAFAPKVIHMCGPGQEFGDDPNKTPASARHKRGCNCRKSSCLKKYCECFQTGVGCSTSCRCERCKNSFGRREGVFLLTIEKMEIGNKEKGTYVNEEKLEFDKRPVVVQSGDLPSAENLLTTPLTEPCRSSVLLPSTCSNPQLSSMRCSSQLHNTQSPMKADALLSPLETYAAEMILGTGSTHIQEGGSSCTTSVKVVSPNKKRVSPLHIGTCLSPVGRSGRKLILKSIPSFPSLTGDVVSPTKSAFGT